MDKTLIVSISGIRGIFGRGLDPDVIVRYAGAYASWVRSRHAGTSRPKVVVGRDGRVTGPVCSELVSATLRSCGCDVIDAGLATTPTVEMAVIARGAAGGIILSASHNPAEWNALKLLNEKGEFLSPGEAQEVITLADGGDTAGVPYDEVGWTESHDFLVMHAAAILSLPFIDPPSIGAKRLRVVVDGINSVGGVAIPYLLRQLGVDKDRIVCVNCAPTGHFAHPAEPLRENLSDTCRAVAEARADIGIVVDPDADRLALIDENGSYVVEELTQVIAADFLWGIRTGPFVTNLSSSRAIEDVASRYGVEVHRSAVGEINVVKKMQEVGAVLGGEGNGGVILPDLHYGRDALVGVAMILQHLVNLDTTLSELVASLPAYHIVKEKVGLGDLDADAVLGAMARTYKNEQVSTVDGVKIDFDDGWVHLRKSNTEPILRVYSESSSASEARQLAEKFMGEIRSL